MEEKQIRKLLYSKMKNEYNNFLEKLKTYTIEEVIEHSYEQIIKQEVLSMFYPETEEFNILQIKTLNKFNNPLEEIYNSWMNSDRGINEVLKENIYDYLEELVIHQKKHNKLER